MKSGAVLAVADVVLLPPAPPAAQGFLVFAALGSSPLWLAVFADTGATVIVTLNGPRLLRLRE